MSVGFFYIENDGQILGLGEYLSRSGLHLIGFRAVHDCHYLVCLRLLLLFIQL